MFLLLHVDELSIFSAYQASLPGEKKVDTERLKRDLCPRKPIEIKYFSQICNDMMNKKDRLGDIMLGACALVTKRIDLLRMKNPLFPLWTSMA